MPARNATVWQRVLWPGNVRGCLTSKQAEAYDRFQPTYPDLVIDELLPGVDHLVLAAPATPRTARLIGADELSAVKPGCTS